MGDVVVYLGDALREKMCSEIAFKYNFNINTLYIHKDTVYMAHGYFISYTHFR